MTYDEWLSILPHDRAQGLRLGQSFVARVLPNAHNPLLFFTLDESTAWGIINRYKEDYQW